MIDDLIDGFGISSNEITCLMSCNCCGFKSFASLLQTRFLSLIGVNTESIPIILAPLKMKGKTVVSKLLPPVMPINATPVVIQSFDDVR